MRNQDDAEEVIQQGMLNIFTHLAELAERDHFRQWAMRIVENEAKMYRRKRRQHLYQSLVMVRRAMPMRNQFGPGSSPIAPTCSTTS